MSEEARYSLGELRETLLADPYFMECIRDAAEKVPQRSPFPGMTGGWFDEFFDSEREKEDGERHGYRWAMRTASTDDEVFEAIELTLDSIGFNKDWSAGELAVFEYQSQREFGYGCSCPGVRYSIHEIGGLYFAWYFRETSVEMWDTMDSDDRHDRRIGSFYITFEDALEDVSSWVDSDLEYERGLCEERWREEKRMEGGCEDSGVDKDEDCCSWFDDECPEFDFSLSRSFAEHALGRGARIVPAELHPGHDVSRRFPPGHRLLRESHSDMESAEGWRVGGQDKKPVIDLSFSRWDSPLPPVGFLPEDACCSYTLDELGGSLLASAHFLKKIHLAATNFAREIPDSRGCLQALEHPESGKEAFAAVSAVLNSINFGGVSAERTINARFTGSGFHSQGTDLIIITVHCIGMLFFVWCWYIVPIEGSGSSRQAAKGRVGDFFVTYDDALRAAFNLAEAWSGAERAELSKRTNLYDRQKEASGGADIGRRPELNLSERWDLDEFESSPLLGREPLIVPSAVHPGHDLGRRLRPGDPVYGHISFVSLKEEEERRERLKAYLERMRNRRAW